MSNNASWNRVKHVYNAVKHVFNVYNTISKNVYAYLYILKS